MSAIATLALSLTYTPPGGAANSGKVSASAGPTYTPQCASTIDVPPSTATGATFAVDFGTVAEAQILLVKNGLPQDLNVFFNGATAGACPLPAGGFIAVGATAAAGAQLSSVDLVTTALSATAATGAIETHVFGAL